jgi:hypothetical protein
MTGSSNDPLIRGENPGDKNKVGPSDADFDALFNPSPEEVDIDNLALIRSLGIDPDAECHTIGELNTALEIRVTPDVFRLAKRPGAETPLGVRNEDEPYGLKISRFELRTPDGHYVIPDAQMLGAPIAPSGPEKAGDGLPPAKKYLATVDHAGHVDETSFELVASGPVSVILIERSIEKGAGFDVELQVSDWKVVEELLARIEKERKSPEHYRSAIARFFLDKLVNEQVREHIGGAELLEELQYLKIERIKSGPDNIARYNLAVAIPPAGVFETNYQALEINGVVVMLDKDRLLRFSGGERRTAGLASEYPL